LVNAAKAHFDHCFALHNPAVATIANLRFRMNGIGSTHLPFASKTMFIMAAQAVLLFGQGIAAETRDRSQRVMLV
jgi:hypothetical protein